jgi:two-component system, cell cycle sensor histidine kinase and response regulator CckA
MKKNILRFQAFYLVSFFVLFAVGLSLAGYFYFYQQKQRLMRSANDNLLSIAKLKIGQIENWRLERMNDANFIFHSEAISRQFLDFFRNPNGHKEREAMLGWMEPMFKNRQYVSMDIYDSGRRHLFCILNDSCKTSAYENDIMTEAAREKQVLFSDLHLNDDGRICMGLVIPIITIMENDTIAFGSMLMRIDPWRFLYPLLQSWPVVSKTSETLILRKEGTEIVYLNELKHQAGNNLSFRMPLKERELPAAIEAHRYEGIIEARDYRNKEVVAAVRQIPNSPWFMIAKTDIQEVLEGNTKVGLGVTAVTALILLLLASGTRMIWKEQEVKRYQELLKSQQERQALIQHFDYLVRYANDVIFLCDESQRIIEANERAGYTYGYAHEEMLNMHLSDLWMPEFLSDLEQKLASMMTSNGAVFETRHRRKNGSAFPVEISGRTIMIEGKIYYQGIVRDITERKEADKALREREKQLALVTGNFPGLTSSVDRNLRYRFASTGYDRIFGKPSTAVVGLSMQEVLGEEVFRHVEPYVHQALLGKKNTFINPVKIPGGEVSYGLTTFIPDTDENGTINGIFIFAVDITDLIETEDALRKTEENFRRSLDDSPLGVRIMTAEGETLYMNRAILNIYDYKSIEEFHKTSLKERYTPESYLEFTKRREQRNRGEFGPSEYEISIVRKNGEVRHVQVLRTEVFWNGAKQYQAIYQDITERKKLEEPLRRMQKMEGLGTLAGGIAHDFNNILGIILGYVSRIHMIKDDPEQLKKAVGIITTAVERGTTLVKQILTFARKTETEYCWVNVNDIAKEVIVMIMETFPKTISYSQNLEKGLPPVYADHSQIHQALLNLCVNARDAMQAGGVLSIATCLHSGTSVRKVHSDAFSDRYVCIEVNDTGIGMTAEIRSRIFEPFFTTKEKGKGTGLGLAVVFGIVQTHRGYIDAESELGHGAKFRILLPVTHDEEHAEQPSTQQGDVIPGGFETLLIVEDEKVLNENLHAILTEKGYTVLTAFDGLNAMNIYQERQQDIALVITDLGLPKMTGAEGLKRMKQLNPNAKIIVVTGYLDPDVKSEFLKAGIQKIIYKPYNANIVLKVVREVLDKT